MPYLPFTKKETNGEILLLKFSPGDLGWCMSLLYYPRFCSASLDIYRVAGPCCEFHTMHFTLCISHYTFHTKQFILYISQYAFHTIHSIYIYLSFLLFILLQVSQIQRFSVSCIQGFSKSFANFHWLYLFGAL